MKDINITRNHLRKHLKHLINEYEENKIEGVDVHDEKNLKDLIKEIAEIVETVSLNDKLYYTQYGVGSSKYSVNYHNGIKQFKDGSDFYDFKTFTNKKEFNKFIEELKEAGYKLNYK